MIKILKKVLFLFLVFQITRILPDTQIQNFPDPFSSQRNKKNISAESKKVEAKNTLELLGVIKKENSFGAVIQKENEQEVVFLNDKIWGYSVKKIQADSVVLLKGEEEIILLIS